MVEPNVLPDRSQLMLLMPILPMLLIGTILLATALDARGLLGPPRRKVSLGVPLAAICAGMALAAAFIHVASAVDQFAANETIALVELAGVAFLVAWALAHLIGRNSATAVVGMVGTAAFVAVWIATQRSGHGFTLGDLFGVSFEVALLFALTPQVAPSLAARLAERRMKVQRAFVLAMFCVAATTLFTTFALVG